MKCILSSILFSDLGNLVYDAVQFRPVPRNDRERHVFNTQAPAATCLACFFVIQGTRPVKLHCEAN